VYPCTWQLLLGRIFYLKYGQVSGDVDDDDDDDDDDDGELARIDS
jgi:hypothetical protein